MAKFYLQGESALTIFTEAEEVAKLRVEVKEKNKQLQQIINSLVSESMQLKNDTAELNVKSSLNLPN